MLHLLQMAPFRVLTTFLRILGSSLLLELPPCCISGFSGDNTVTSSSDFSSFYSSTFYSGHLLLMQHFHPPPTPSNLLSPFRPFCIFSLCSLTTASCSWLSLYTSCFLFLSDSLRVLQWNTGGLQAKSTELLHFLSSHLVDLMCIQESNINSSSFFWNPGFSAVRSDCIHSGSGILSPDAMHACGSIIIFVRLGLSFS